MPRYRAALPLTTLLLCGCAGFLLSGCTGDDRTPAGKAASAVPRSASPESAAPAPATPPFPFTVNRRGGFAGVDEHAEISADGTVVVTTRDRSVAPASVPVATMDELRRLLTSPAFVGGATAPSAPTCADGFEYELVTPAEAMTVLDCGDSHGPEIDRLVDISAGLFNR